MKDVACFCTMIYNRNGGVNGKIIYKWWIFKQTMFDDTGGLFLVYSWRWLSFASCQTQFMFMFMFIPTWVMISPMAYMAFHDATPLENRSDDQSLGRQISAGSDEHIGAYRVLFGCLWVREPKFFSKKRGFDAAPNGDSKVDLEQVGHSERNWKHGASQEITEWCGSIPSEMWSCRIFAHITISISGWSLL